jgi:hypothetical protein
MIKLSIPDISLCCISSTPECQLFSELTRRARTIAKDGGTSMQGFQMRVKHLLGLVHNGKDVAEYIKKIADIRPVINLWQTNPVFRKKQPVSIKVLQSFEQLSPTLGTLSLVQLMRLYFDKYDLLENGKEPLREFLQKQIARRNGSPLIGDLKKLAAHQSVVLHRTATNELVKFCLQKKYPLIKVISQMGIPFGDENRFISICESLYYIESIKKLSIGETSEVFSELTQNKVHTMPYEDRMIGHAAIEILIDKCLYSKSDLPDNWRDIILSIAGDPRVPHSHQNFIKWWSVINYDRTQWMQQWLSKIDLELFLVILNEYAKNSGNDIERMFPARARFLEGLHKARFIKSSRLFLGDSASDFLKKHFIGRTLPSYAALNTSSKAIVYFKVDNIHCIDGTHSFPLLMFEKLPKETPIGDYHNVIFSEKSLNQLIIEGYEKLRLQGLAKKDYVRIIHHPNLGWQYKAIKAFREFGIKVDPANVLTRHDFNNYLSKYPL